MTEVIWHTHTWSPLLVVSTCRNEAVLLLLIFSDLQSFELTDVVKKKKLSNICISLSPFSPSLDLINSEALVLACISSKHMQI